MTVEGRVVPLRDVRLPWNACLLTALAAAVAFVVADAAGAVGRWPGLGALVYWVPWGAADGALAGLGCALLDRVRPRWRRPARWALGMGLAGLVPLSTMPDLLGGWVSHPPHADLWDVASPMAASVVAGALVGACLAAAAEAHPRSHGFLLGAGVLTGVASTAVYAGIWGLMCALSPCMSVVTYFGAWVQPVLDRCAYTALLGLALGDRLWAAWRKQADEEAVDGA
jgi:hypothetical protein